MRVLLLNQFFWPDSSATSQLLTDLARKLASEGHDVYAISAERGYATGAAGEAPAVKMHGVKALPFVRGTAGRVLSYLSFYLSAAARGMTLPRADLVITLTTPPLLSVLGTLLKMLRGSRHFIWEMDVYPDVAVDLAYFRAGGIADRATGLIADWSRRHADGIIALGECMKRRLVGRGIPGDKVFVADNWADGSAIRPVVRSGDRSGDRSKLVLLYSGNLGLAHDVDTIAGAMRVLKADSHFSFVFAGSGARRAILESFCTDHGIGSAEFRPYADRERLGDSLGAGDIGLVTQKENCSGSVVPSKVYGLMAAGRPILFIGPSDATPAQIIRRFQCGWHVECGDVVTLVNLLRNLAAHPEQVNLAGHNARIALLQHFDLPIGVARICAIIGATTSKDYLLEIPSATRNSSSNNQDNCAYGT